MKNFILKYKNYLIFIVIAGFIIIYLQFINKQKNDVESPIITPQPQTSVKYTPTSKPEVNREPDYTEPRQELLQGNNEGSTEIVQAVNNKKRLAKYLPIYIKDFKNSNGILTTLNVYTIPEDPDYQIRIEIYGISYENQSVSKSSNPDLVAFIDSFNEVKRQLSNKGVDIHNIYFKFGQKSYIQNTADLWIRTFNLL